ncbi:hypothetical protein [Streptomyces sp. S063]|uniref:hypothetical protein n=1 Tax=Streptomyces sp. S063 TaxID=2005885 RepID=UPI003FCD59BA
MRERVAVLGGTLSAAPRPDGGFAVHMVVTPCTAKAHVSRAMSKLGARDRARFVVFAYESGLVEPRSWRDGGPAPAR